MLVSGLNPSYLIRQVTFQEVFSCRFPLSLVKVLNGG
jgi:hypothetical protein